MDNQPRKDSVSGESTQHDRRRAVFISSPELWRYGFGGKHPLKPERLARTVALLEGYDAFKADNAAMVEPRLATDEELARFHTPEYILVVKALSDGNGSGAETARVPARRYGFGAGDNPVFRGMDKVSRLKSGGGLVGAEMLLADDCDVAFNFSGGLHHAMPAKASGFCIYNDIAVTIAWLLTQGRRVAYVDIDAHHGDGVQAAFEETDQVLTISLHQDGHTLFPGTGFVDETGRGKGEGTSVNVPLSPQTDDETYLWAFREIVPPLVRRFAPDVLVSQLGADTHYTDPLTWMGLTTEGHHALYKEFAALTPGKWFACGGGGYNIDVVPRSWTLAFGVMSEQTFPDKLPQSYREQYGGRWLHDREGPAIDSAARDRARRQAEEVVEAVKNQFGI